MTSIQGVICPNCGIHHNAPELHKCKWTNPKYAQDRTAKLELRRQNYKCAFCRRQLLGRYNEKRPTDDQYVFQDGRCICVACSDSLRERRAEYIVDVPNPPDIIRT